LRGSTQSASQALLTYSSRHFLSFAASSNTTSKLEVERIVSAEFNMANSNSTTNATTNGATDAANGGDDPQSSTDNNNDNNDDRKNGRDGDGRWLFRCTILILVIDLVVSILIMSPLLPWVRKHEDYSRKFVFSSSLVDLLLLCWLRVLACVVGFLISFLKGHVRSEYPFDIHHPNGTKKTQEELLEQPFRVWFGNYVHRAAFPTEFVALVTTIVCVIKCLVRLNVEIGILRDAEPLHPLYWCAILFSAVMSLVELSCADRVSMRLSEWGQKDREQEGSRSFLRQISSHLSLPLLANDSLGENGEDGDDEEGQQSQSQQDSDEHVTGVSDLDSNYKASWTDLLQLCAPDSFLILVAFIFLILAAAAQIYIPYFTGAILDALERAYSGNDDDDDNGHGSISDVPGFTSNVHKLIVVSILGGVFSGIRGSIFTVVGGRVNVRLRLRLMDSLLTQDQGFYDVTKVRILFIYRL
jgi:ABC transporter transmembrane region